MNNLVKKNFLFWSVFIVIASLISTIIFYSFMIFYYRNQNIYQEKVFLSEVKFISFASNISRISSILGEEDSIKFDSKELVYNIRKRIIYPKNSFIDENFIKSNFIKDTKRVAFFKKEKNNQTW